MSLLFFFRRGSERKSVPRSSFSLSFGGGFCPLPRCKEGEFLPARILIFSKNLSNNERLWPQNFLWRLFVLFPQKFARAAYIFPRKQSMVDFETRVFAGTPVTFAKIPGDPVKFVPLQYSLMPFPVRPFVFFLIKLYSENTLWYLSKHRNERRRTFCGQRRERDSFLLDISVKSNVKVFFSFECVLLLTVSLVFSCSFTDISQFVRASFLFEHQRHFEGS